MKAEVRITRSFKKTIKPLLKKYASLLTDLAKLEKQLVENPKMGTPLGNNVYKIKLKIKSKGKGKSGGARVISFIESEIIGFVDTAKGLTVVNLISIYDKSDRETINNSELRDLIKYMET